MKKMSIAAIICAVVFLLCAVGSGVCLTIGVSSFLTENDIDIIATVSDYCDSFFSFVENLGSSIEPVSPYATTSGTEIMVLDCQLSEIVIDGVCSKITVLPADAESNEVTVDYDGIYGKADNASFSFVLEEEGSHSVLTISPTVRQDSSRISAIGTVTIYLPNLAKCAVDGGCDLTFKNTVGNISISDFTFNNVTLSDTLGDIDIDSVKVSVITCEDTVGQIDASGEFGGIVIYDNVGDCTIKSSTELTCNSSIRNNVAVVKITLPASSRINFTTSDTIGSVSIDDQLKDSTSPVSFDISDSLGAVTIKAK